VSILKRLGTQLSDIRWGFETTSIDWMIISDMMPRSGFKTASNEHQTGVTTRNGGNRYVF
jgi:hypothetical protein